MKENSIEEAIKIMEHWVEYEKNNKEKINKAEELINIQETILLDYKRVLKENEILKKEKEQAWEEWNNLEQGSYETEQKLKQQIKESQRENEELNEKILDNSGIYQLGFKDGEESYIKKVKDIIDRIDYDIKKTKEIISKNTNIYASYRKNDYQITRLKAMNTKSLDIKNRLQELLEKE